MEMKHLGSTLRLAVHVPSPAGGAHAENPLCACACACQHRRRCDGTGPRGRRCHVKVTMRGRRGGRGHLLAGSSKMRVTAIHLSENTLIQEPICPAPLGHSPPPRGASDPRCCSADWASCSYSLQPNKTASVHLRPEAFLGCWNTVQSMRDSAAGLCCFTGFG